MSDVREPCERDTTALAEVAPLAPLVQPVHVALTDEQAWAVWLLDMQVRGLTEKTKRARLELKNNFSRRLGKPLIDATRQDMLRFLAQPHFSPATRTTYRAALHAFYTLLQDEGYRLDNPTARIPTIRAARKEPNPLTTAQVQRLLDAGMYARTRMMVLLAAYQGFRAQEIAAVHGRNIDWDSRTIYTAEAKGGAYVWRPMHSLVWEEAQKYPRDAFWFPNWMGNRRYPQREGHVLANSVSTLLGKAMRRAGIVGHRPHQLRAWHATEIMEAGADTMVAQYSMRHANQSTLQRYVRPSTARIREAMERLPKVDVPTASGRGSHD